MAPILCLSRHGPVGDYDDDDVLLPIEGDHVIAYRCNHFSAHALFTDSTMGVHTKWDVKRRER